ncbi:Cysteine-rich receptor-like protein kinase [Actinidia chinensis var. chinensis]|uniref:Cysteine-rich receptor-like protein kinase n=1 Tax=Actinidia chinensis var. chinensis TaxID=1590841 RepID=A0A2R6P9Y8_ACTCC|nr:Cysteine-rich receptor-like protein kinase [Actinidia chinensis var. chinensis]
MVARFLNYLYEYSLSLSKKDTKMLFLLLTSLFLYSPRLSLAYENPRVPLCNTKTVYAANSTFHTNLVVALAILQKTTAATGFNATTVGNSTADSVTALALCRANLFSQDCQTCVDAATLGIRDSCPNATVAQVWYTSCMVRYSRINFINQSDSSIAFILYNRLDAPDPGEYDRKVKILMQDLSYAAGVSNTRSSVAKTSFGTRNIYGYVDCTRDISGSDCTTCLLDAAYAIPSCCSGKWAGWIGTPTCNVQFNMDPVDHDDWINNPPEINTDISPAQAPAASPVVRPPANQTTRGSGGSLNGKEKGVVIAVAVAFILVVGVVVVRWRVRSAKGKGAVETEETTRTMTESIGVRSFVYDLDVLVAATDNFSPANQLGGGGFGSVYQGKLPSGEEIAVKKLKAGSTQGIEEFLNEVNLLVNMQHRNLVKLLGCFVQGEEMMLVYEYLPNKSLDYFLFDKSKSALLGWTKRFNIIMGVARGLLYLHEDSQIRIIHRDIKASNILLDEQMNPKISDFGLAKLFSDEESRLRTRRIVGTFGYMAPEYVIQGVVSTKSDVYSFGILILEIISGRKMFDLHLDEEMQQLLEYTKRLKQEGRLMELVDVTTGSFPQEDVLRCIQIGLLCCKESVQDRPTMYSALVMLTDNSITLPLSHQDHHNMMENATMSPESFSTNSITMSLANGR